MKGRKKQILGKKSVQLKHFQLKFFLQLKQFKLVKAKSKGLKNQYKNLKKRTITRDTKNIKSTKSAKKRLKRRNHTISSRLHIKLEYMIEMVISVPEHTVIYYLVSNYHFTKKTKKLLRNRKSFEIDSHLFPHFLATKQHEQKSILSSFCTSIRSAV